MKTPDGGHTTNYRSTFLSVSDDCPAAWGTEPAVKEVPTVARIQFELIASNPYRYTSDEVVFEVAARKKGWTGEAREAAWKEFFSRGQPCLRASPLGKTYGWGIHYDSEGRMALVGQGTEEYERLSRDPSLDQIKAMRNAKNR